MRTFTDVREGTVTVGGVDVRYYDTSDADDPRVPIVLLHGTAGAAATNFWALLPMLSFRHRVITFDFKESSAGPLTIEGFVRQVEAVIHKLAPNKPVTLVGYSLGAVVAAVAAAEHPDLVTNLVLISGWVATDGQQKLRNDIWRQLYDSESAALSSFMIFTAFGAPYLSSKSLVEVEELITAAQDGPDRARKMELNRSVDISEQAPKIQAPTLVVGCTHDQMAPIRHSRMLFGAIDDARFAEIESGHAVVHERPAELFTLIDGFATDPAAETAGAVLSSSHA